MDMSNPKLVSHSFIACISYLPLSV